MLKSLYNSQKVQQELKNFESKIMLFSDENKKQEAKKILVKLKEKIQDLDIGHTSNLLGEVRPSLMIHTKDEIYNLRKTLSNLIKSNT